jgi:prevent-host-death family protein
LGLTLVRSTIGGDYGVTVRTVQLQEAKARLSAAVDAAVRDEACVITRHGRRAAVLIGYEEWERRCTCRRSGAC